VPGSGAVSRDRGTAQGGTAPGRGVVNLAAAYRRVRGPARRQRWFPQDLCFNTPPSLDTPAPV